MTKDAYITREFGRGPYMVEIHPIGYCVVNSSGFNVLRFKEKPGAVFSSDFETVQAAARKANEEHA